MRPSTFIALAFFAASIAPVRAELSPEEKEIVRWTAEHEAEALALVEKTVNVNSGTMNHAGVRAVGDAFGAEFAKIGLAPRWIPMPAEVNRAGHLFAEKKGTKGKRLLLIGHLDTVFEKDSPFQKYVREGDVARGPGAADMKSGDVIILYALKALHARGLLADATVTVALTGDEESTGLPLALSRGDLVEAARRSDVALAFEGGTEKLAKVAAARRGYTSWKLTVTGKQGHSSRVFSPEAGDGAIYEAARILDGFQAKLRREKYLTFNPGVILGGTDVAFDGPLHRGTAFGKDNVIARSVVVTGDLRTVSAEQLAMAKRAMEKIVAASRAGTSAKIEFTDSSPPMFATRRNLDLVRQLSRVSQDLGGAAVVAQDPSERGAADASFVAPYVTVIDGLGAAGPGSHSTDERLELKTFLPALQRAAILIYRLTR